MNKFTHFFGRIFLPTVFFLLSFSISSGQSWFSEVNQDGFILKKVVSDTTVASGQAFSYTIYYTIPAGATNVSISDIIPAGLIFLGHTVNNACGTPTVSAPAVNSQGGTFTLSFATVPTACASSFTITVAFPNGVTCPGVTARNRACLNAVLAGKQIDLCTNFLTTTATASNPWHINKYPIGLAWIGGNCPWAAPGDTISYQICVYKDVGATGQLNLVNGVVTDSLPTGAQLVSSNCGASQSGNVITWNVGNMSATSAYNSACCTFTIYYPAAQFPSGSSISNSVTLNGSVGPTQQPCYDFSTSASTCVKKEIITSATLSKWVYTNRQPGCSGQYLIYICNTGTTTIPVAALDTLPTQLTGYSVGTVWPNTFTATITGGILTINGNLNAGQCAYVYVNFTIPSNALVNSTVTNCVYLTSVTPTQSACNTFTIDAPAAKPCVWKEVCNKQTSYSPGSTFRYRLRIQNIGGLPLSGVTLTDVLNPNLSYVGNPSYYTLSTWNVPNCNPTPSSGDVWTGVSLSYNNVNNTVTAALPSIPAACQNIFYNACGMYGTPGVPYYFIEFDVKVKDTSALGNIPNSFNLAGGALGTTTVTSNIENVLVVGVVGFNLNKDVKHPNDTTFSSSLAVTPFSNVVFRLKMNSSGTAALSHITFAELLPLNATPNDQKILQTCGSRGSQFNITYLSPVGSPYPSVPSPYNNFTLLPANVNNLTPAGSPGAAFSIGCGTNGTWSAGITSGLRNFAQYFGSTAAGTSGAEYQFLASIDPTAKPKDNSCNTFAASGWTKHLIQSNLLSYQLAGQVESGPVCLTIKESKPCIENGKIDVECDGYDENGNVLYAFTMSGGSCAPGTLTLSSPDGTFTPSSFSIATSPWTFNSSFVHTNANNPIMIYYTVQCGEEICKDSIMRDLPDCPPPTTPGCCDDFIKVVKDPKLTWNSATGFVGLSASMTAGPAPIKRFSATIVSAQSRRVCGFSPSSWQRIYGDVTNASLVVQPNPGPQLLSIYSREAVWGEADTCVNWMNSANLDLKMIFPPLSGGKLCRDTLRFAIRYSFTDCKCVTCDTVVYYTIVRKPAIIAWDPTGIGHWGLPPAIENEQKKSDPNILADPPASTMLIMKSKTEGSFWIVSPDVPENEITIVGVEFYSPELDFESIKFESNTGSVNGHSALIDVEAAPGDTREINLMFKNDNLNKFNVYAYFKYKINGSEEILVSDAVPYFAIVPGLAGDEMGEDNSVKPSGVRTYAVYLHNKNGYDENIFAVSLKSITSHIVIAIGPPYSGANGILLFPKLQEDGSYYIAMSAEGEAIPPGNSVKPIFITFSGESTSEPELQFNTYNEMGGSLGEGTFKLADPISKVNEAGEPNPFDLSVYPNPAGHFASLSIAVSNLLQMVDIKIYDNLGREVLGLLSNGTLEQGNHLFNIDTEKLTNGVYYIEIRSNSYRETLNFTIGK